MKQLTCEMCGGTDLLKQDGVFVCQTCGCKYSVEEARKMMGEVSSTPVEVKNAAQLENLLNLAKSSFESQRIPLIIVPNPATSSPPTRISRKSAIQAHCLHAK